MPQKQPELDKVVLANARRPPLITSYLQNPKVIWNPDWILPKDFIPVRPYPNQQGAYNCFRGHQLALAACIGNTLLFEDDAVPNQPGWMELIYSLLPLLEEYEIISLHARKLIPSKEFTYAGVRCVIPAIQPRVDRYLPWALGSLAYVIREDMANRIIAMPYTGIPIDLVIHSQKTVIVDPSPFDHDRRFGSLVESVIDVRV